MRQHFARIFPAGSFARNVGVLTGGTVFAQGLTLLALPLLTRLYSPHDFGLLAVYSSVIGIITVVSCLRYNIAIPLPDDDSEAMALLAVALGAGVCVSALIALVVISVPGSITAFLGHPELLPYLWLIPLGVLFASTYNALQYWTSRKRRFALVTRTRITRASGCVGAQLLLGAGSASPFGLIFGHMLYVGLGVVGLARDLFRSDRKVLSGVSFRSAANVTKDYREFPLRSTPAALLDAGYQSMPILILAHVVTPSELGVLFLMLRSMSAPISLVGSSIAQVYLAEAAKRMRIGGLGPFTRHIMLRMFLFGTPALLVFAATFRYGSDLVFGSDYSAVGEIAFWLVPWAVIQLMVSPVSSILTVMDLQATWLALQCVGFVLIVGGTFAATRLIPELSIAFFIGANIVFYAVVASVILMTTYKSTGTV